MPDAMEYLYCNGLSWVWSPADILLELFPIRVDFSESPEKRDLLCEQAEYLRDCGETVEAIEMLLLGLEAAPTDEQMCSILANLLRAKGLEDLADSCEEAASSADTDHKVVERIADEIEEELSAELREDTRLS